MHHRIWESPVNVRVSVKLPSRKFNSSIADIAVKNKGGLFVKVISIVGLWGVRYQVKDVQRSVAFYIDQLGFNLDHEKMPAFA